MHASATRLVRLLRDGAPPALPRTLDRAGEWWARRTPRERVVLTGVAAILALLGGLDPAGGGPTTVLVARRDLPAGATFTAADLDTQRRPTDLAPVGAVSPDPGVGGRLAGPLARGAVLTRAHLGAAHPADRTPHGHVALAIPADQLPPLVAGTVVDLHGGNGVGVRGGLVLGDLDGMAWVAVPRDGAAALVEALAWGPVRVAVVPPEEP